MPDKFVYPEIKNNIVACNEDDWEGPPPKPLREFGIERIVGRQVLDLSPILGTYGMGGPGFFGMKLATHVAYPEEWLVLILWGAQDWLLLDGKWIGNHPDQSHPSAELLYRNYPGAIPWNEVKARLTDSFIEDAQIEDDYSMLKLRQGIQKYQLEIPQDITRLARYAGSLQFRRWFPFESQLDAWIISRTGEVYC